MRGRGKVLPDLINATPPSTGAGEEVRKQASFYPKVKLFPGYLGGPLTGTLQSAHCALKYTVDTCTQCMQHNGGVRISWEEKHWNGIYPNNLKRKHFRERDCYFTFAFQCHLLPLSWFSTSWETVSSVFVKSIHTHILNHTPQSSCIVPQHVSIWKDLWTTTAYLYTWRSFSLG